MMKLIPLLVNNQKLVQLSQLPIDQANDLREFLPIGSIRKFIFQGIELPDCVPFETYEYWFNSMHVQRLDYGSILDF